MRRNNFICGFSSNKQIFISFCVNIFISFIVIGSCGVLAGPHRCLDLFNCDLGEEKKVVSCRDQGIDNVPLCLNPSLVSLSLFDTAIHTLYVTSFRYYADLKYVDLSQSKISTIEKNTFEYQEALEELHLSDNQIGRLESEMLTGLNRLTVLSLRGNLIEELQDGLFQHLPLLEHLDLSHNRITKVGINSFLGNERLTVLHLSQNRLQEVPRASLKLLTHIAELSVGGNAFHTIDKADFQSMKSLVSLDLSNTPLKDGLPRDLFQHMKHIRVLKINDCQLDHVPSEALSLLASLESIELSRNLFTAIPKDAFKFCTNLESLKITGSPHLERLSSGALKHNLNLVNIDLSRNGALMYLPYRDFRFLSRLSFLDLHGNALEFIPRNLASWNDINIWRLHDNPLWCNCSASWLREMVKFANRSNMSPIVCANPLELRGVPLSETHIDDLLCGLDSATQSTVIALSICGLLIIIGCTAFLLIYRNGPSCIQYFLKGDSKWTRGVRRSSNPRLYDNSDYPYIKPVPVTEL